MEVAILDEDCTSLAGNEKCWCKICEEILEFTIGVSNIIEDQKAC
jgi:hypothetical protein